MFYKQAHLSLVKEGNLNSDSVEFITESRFKNIFFLDIFVSCFVFRLLKLRACESCNVATYIRLPAETMRG